MELEMAFMSEIKSLFMDGASSEWFAGKPLLRLSMKLRFFSLTMFVCVFIHSK